MNRNYTYEELVSHQVAIYEETVPSWKARDTLNYLKSNNVEPHESYGLRCHSTSMCAGKGLAASKLHANDMKRKARGWKVKLP
jgi:hypothetical protein